uniref:Protein kinase domain-containing protein n=1 Tax=Oryza brachyantha TaxID=4533 RepID=J3KW88_ORYBR
MLPFPAPACPVLCLTMVPRALPVASSAFDAINATTSAFCEPAKCGNLTIGYPFWLAGAHLAECGYRTFNHGNASLKKEFWTYQIQRIFYHNSSFRVTTKALECSGTACRWRSSVEAGKRPGREGKKLRYVLCTKASSTSEKNIENLIVSYGSLAPKRYKYSEVTKITSFLNNKLGEGGYGVVFKGRLQDGRLVAVKFLRDSEGNGEEFVNEVMSIGRTSHVNVVSLFGFCLEGSKRALLYEYMSNGSLDNYIYSESLKEILGWDKLYRIAIGIARGLEYLHHGCNTRIVHFDIKPQNILLDQDFCPKIADFGLAKLCQTKESKLTMTGARGTIGFIAPEVIYRTFGIVSTKSDVYSYGMMLLEMVGGRKNVKQMVENSSEKYFPDWIYDHFALDDGLQACEVTVVPMHRPTMTQVLDMFERGLDELEMPPKQNFCELLEHPIQMRNTDSTSCARSSKDAQAVSEVLKVEEISLVNSENTIGTTNSAKR